MSTRHVVQKGEFLSLIAERFGFTWQTLWESPDNADLRARRQSPDVLFPGDVVMIPDKEIKQAPIAPGSVTRLVVRQGFARLRLRIMLEDQPVPNEPYVLTFPGSGPREQTTDADGFLDEPLPPGADSAVLEVPGLFMRNDVLIGHLEAPETPAGAQARLRQLGFSVPDVSGELDDATVAALRAFQKKESLDDTGALDDATAAALAKAFGV